MHAPAASVCSVWHPKKMKSVKMKRLIVVFLITSSMISGMNKSLNDADIEVLLTSKKRDDRALAGKLFCCCDSKLTREERARTWGLSTFAATGCITGVPIASSAGLWLPALVKVVGAGGTLVLGTTAFIAPLFCGAVVGAGTYCCLGGCDEESYGESSDQD